MKPTLECFTRRERTILAALIRGEWARSITSFGNWRKVGDASPYERTLSNLADRGFVLWADAIDDAEISPKGREAYETEACRKCGHARNVHRNMLGKCSGPGSSRNWHMCICPVWRAT